MVLGLVELLPHEMESAEGAVDLALSIVEGVSLLGLLQATAEQRWVLIEERPLKERASQPRVPIA